MLKKIGIIFCLKLIEFLTSTFDIRHSTFVMLMRPALQRSQGCLGGVLGRLNVGCGTRQVDSAAGTIYRDMV
jgi:hypothetical protein